MGMRNAQASDTTTPRATMQTVTVKAGQTLWTIAEKVAPNDDPRATIYAIQQINGLKTSAVTAGQQIIIPVTQ
jgi:LysM repeat protein